MKFHVKDIGNREVFASALTAQKIHDCVHTYIMWFIFNLQRKYFFYTSVVQYKHKKDVEFSYIALKYACLG